MTVFSHYVSISIPLGGGVARRCLVPFLGGMQQLSTWFTVCQALSLREAIKLVFLVVSADTFSLIFITSFIRRRHLSLVHLYVCDEWVGRSIHNCPALVACCRVQWQQAAILSVVRSLFVITVDSWSQSITTTIGLKSRQQATNAFPFTLPQVSLRCHCLVSVCVPRCYSQWYGA